MSDHDRHRDDDLAERGEAARKAVRDGRLEHAAPGTGPDRSEAEAAEDLWGPGSTEAQGRTTRPDADASGDATFEGRPLEGDAEDGPGRRRMAYPDGPMGHAPATESAGDPDADDEASSAEAGAIGGAVAGTGLAGPIGGFIGATLGGLAGAGAEAIEPEEVSPGRVIREPYGHPVAIPEVRATADEAREDGSAGPDATRPVADDGDDAPPLT